MKLVSFADAEPNGLARMMGDLIAANLERDATLTRLLKPAVVSIEATDAEVAVTLRIRAGSLVVENGLDASADIVVTAGSQMLLELARTPLRLGLPDVFTPGGRAVVGKLLRRQMHVAGLVRHPVRLASLNRLLSAN